MNWEESSLLSFSSILVADSFQNQKALMRSSNQQILLMVDYVGSQLVFLWQLTNVPVQQCIFTRHVFVFDVQKYSQKQISACCEQLLRNMKLGDMFKVMYADGTTALNWTEKTLTSLDFGGMPLGRPSKTKLLRTVTRVFERLATFAEPTSVAIFTDSMEFLTAENELKLAKLKIDLQYAGLLCVFAEDNRQPEKYAPEDQRYLRQAYTLYEGFKPSLMNLQFSEYFCLLAKLRAISAEITVECLDSVMELQEMRNNRWRQHDSRSCKRKLHTLNNYCTYQERLMVNMVQLAGARVMVRFDVKLLDGTMMTAERAFYIQQENASETTDRLPLTNMTAVVNNPYISECRKRLPQSYRLDTSKVKLRPETSSTDSPHQEI